MEAQNSTYGERKLGGGLFILLEQPMLPGRHIDTEKSRYSHIRCHLVEWREEKAYEGVGGGRIVVDDYFLSQIMDYHKISATPTEFSYFHMSFPYVRDRLAAAHEQPLDERIPAQDVYGRTYCRFPET
ncbi:Dipeptidase [Gryllus bimaculatus]|nr:Dipeptidase [Gryllus bimaculatus]